MLNDGINGHNNINSNKKNIYFKNVLLSLGTIQSELLIKETITYIQIKTFTKIILNFYR